MFPIEKYRFIVTEDKVIALSTYAGRTVRGVAKCAPGDTFDVEYGKKLAAARCNKKVAYKRWQRAKNKHANAEIFLDEAIAYRKEMLRYYNDSYEDYSAAENEVNELLGK